MDIGPVTFRHWQRHKDGVTSSHDEALAQAYSAQQVLQALQACQPAREHFSTVLDDQPGARAADEQAGCVCTVTEFLMVLKPAEMRGDAPSHTVQVAVPEDVTRLNAGDVQQRAGV